MDVDWDKGLSVGLLAHIAGGHDELKSMRLVSKRWNAGFERSVTKLWLSRQSSSVAKRGSLEARFPGVKNLMMSLLNTRAARGFGSRLDTLDGAKLLSLTHEGGLNLQDDDLMSLWGAPLVTFNLIDCYRLSGLGMRWLLASRLTSLSLRGCGALTDEGVAVLRGLRLRHLDLGLCCRVTNEGLAHLEGMPLEDLDLACLDKVTAEGLAHLRGMPLRRLGLAFWQCLTVEGLFHLRWCPQLAALDLQQSRWLGGDVLFWPFSWLRNLTELNLSGLAWPRDGGLGHCRYLPLPLTTLDLTDCVWPLDVVLEQLKGTPLKTLKLAWHQDTMLRGRVTSAGLVHLEGLPLTALDLEGCGDFVAKDLKFLKGLPLTDLNLGAVYGWDGEGVDYLEGMPLVTLCLAGSLSTWYMTPFNDDWIRFLKGSQITSLNLGFCWPLSDEGVSSLKRLPLRKLVLYGCKRVTGKSFSVFKGMPLEVLILAHCTNLANEGLMRLLPLGLSLKCLDLTGCRLLDHSGIAELLSALEPGTDVGAPKAIMFDASLPSFL